jgi:hypothetical protein
VTRGGHRAHAVTDERVRPASVTSGAPLYSSDTLRYIFHCSSFSHPFIPRLLSQCAVEWPHARIEPPSALLPCARLLPLLCPPSFDSLLLHSPCIHSLLINPLSIASSMPARLDPLRGSSWQLPPGAPSRLSVEPLSVASRLPRLSYPLTHQFLFIQRTHLNFGARALRTSSVRMTSALRAPTSEAHHRQVQTSENSDRFVR